MQAKLPENQMNSAFSLSPEELDAYCQAKGYPKFRTEQVKNWLFTHFAASPNEMSNLPKAIKNDLQNDFSWELPSIASHLNSEDGASKLLLKGEKGQYFEAVILRYENRVSLCVSSQVGCKLACSFCQTGKLGFFRNLKAGEIVGQFVLANRILKEEGRKISHIVFMGMGEPLDNFDAVTKATQLFTAPNAYGLSYRRVTVSTSGVVPKIAELAKKTHVSLAVSLHASRDELRSELMPINRKYNLEKLKTALSEYQKATDDLITIEYILIGEKNCSRREAKELVKFLHGLKAKVNLIPFNSHPGLPYKRPSEEETREFQKYLSARGYPSPVRYSKGLEVSAACGQLAAKHKESIHSAPKRKNVIQTTPKELPQD